MTSSAYTVGALSSLLSGDSADKIEDNVEKKKKKKRKAGKNDLFTTDKKQEEQPRPVVAPKSEEKGRDDDKPVKAKKRKIFEQDEVEENEEDETKTQLPDAKFNGPSLRRRVMEEDKRAKENVSKRDPEKEKRTVFVGNLPSDFKEKELRTLFKDAGKIEAVRFRGAARPDMKTTKKAAVIKRQLHEQRHNLIAYVRYENLDMAKNAVEKFHGVKLEPPHSDFVIRVDLAMKEEGTNEEESSKRNPKLALFIGNLAFDCEENDLRKHFVKCGKISDVRIVRDSSSGIGKGFGYVNFYKEEAVTIGLNKNGSQLAGRAIRVSRCSKKAKVSIEEQQNGKSPTVRRITSKKFKDRKSKEFQGKMAKSKKDGAAFMAKKNNNAGGGDDNHKKAEATNSKKGGKKGLKFSPKKQKKKVNLGEKRKKNMAKKLMQN